METGNRNGNDNRANASDSKGKMGLPLRKSQMRPQTKTNTEDRQMLDRLREEMKMTRRPVNRKTDSSRKQQKQQKAERKAAEAQKAAE